MPDDPVPVPPNDQGLPPRPAPFQPVPGNFGFVRCNPVDGVPVIALVYDSPDVRLVSYWSEEAFVSMAQKMLAFIGDGGLTTADMEDLKRITEGHPLPPGFTTP